jgi:hypothetical protein
MDHFSATHASALPSAGLPGATACHVSMAIPGELISDQPDQPVPQSSLGLGGRQLYSKEQWDAQKQFIWRLYNQENKPFKRVMEILRTEHNFVPTYILLFLLCHDHNLYVWIYSDGCYRRRQFYRKINEWGFEKNIKEIEMRAIAENLENGGSGGPVELKGRQIDTAKIQRWQKRQGRMKGVVNASQSQLGAGRLHGSQILDRPNTTYSPNG